MKRYKKIEERIRKEIPSSDGWTVSHNLNSEKDAVLFSICAPFAMNEDGNKEAIRIVLKVHADSYTISYGTHSHPNVSRWKTIQTILKHVVLHAESERQNLSNYRKQHSKNKIKGSTIQVDGIDIETIRSLTTSPEERSSRVGQDERNARLATIILFRDFLNNIFLTRVRNAPDELITLSELLLDWTREAYVPNLDQINAVRNILINLQDSVTELNETMLWEAILKRSFMQSW